MQFVSVRSDADFVSAGRRGEISERRGRYAAYIGQSEGKKRLVTADGKTMR